MEAASIYVNGNFKNTSGIVQLWLQEHPVITRYPLSRYPLCHSSAFFSWKFFQYFCEIRIAEVKLQLDLKILAVSLTVRFGSKVESEIKLKP